ncbi:MAC/perforin domain-containing protein [Moorena producens]|uniref:MAC/perforin domain-containing protein n=1 Tax=Moorena producens TaxID=1155739 RepID=UPI003C76D6EE
MANNLTDNNIPVIDNNIPEIPIADNLTGIDYLGCIYDIYGYYARANSVDTSKRLFSLPDADTEITVYGNQYSYPKDAIGTPVLLSEARQITSSSESTEDLYTQMSVSANLSGSYGLFSAEVSAKYSKSYTSSSYFYHAEELGYVNSYKLTLDLDYALNNLDQEFKDDLYTMDAQELVAKYGTHFLYEAVFGGRWSYSQSVSKFSYSSSQEAEVEVKANYSNYSGSVSASSDTDKSQSNNQSNGQFWCIGGTPNTLVDGFDAWTESVPGNFVLVDFTSDSLKRISELVENDDARKNEIDAAIQAVLDEGKNPSTTELTTSSKTDVWSKGDDNIDKEIEVDSGAKDGYAVVGFGGRIKDKKFNLTAVCYLNLSTAQRQWEVFGDQTTFNQTDYETLGEVPEGCVVTGIGLKGDDSNFRKMVLHYQELTPARSVNNYLDSNLQSIAFKLQDTLDQPESSYDVEFNPGDNNDMVITGIGVGYRGKKERVQYLKLYRNTIVENNQ